MQGRVVCFAGVEKITPVFVISLARAAERRADIARRLDAANIRHEIVDAVDGSALDLSQIADRYDEKNPQTFPLTRGEIGCYLSHYQLWERIVKESIPHAVIMEDDTEWESDFAQAVADVVNCKWQWDVVLLHANVRRSSRVLDALGGGRHLVQYKRHFVGTIAYMISLQGAKKLRDYLYPIRMSVDLAWGHWWRWGGRFYCVRPKVAYENEYGAASTLARKPGSDSPKPTANWRERFAAWFYFHTRRPQRKQ